MENEIKERLARIETKLDLLMQEHPVCKQEISEIKEELSGLKESDKSAHHRINDFKKDVCFTIGTSTTAVGIFSSILTWALGR